MMDQRPTELDLELYCSGNATLRIQNNAQLPASVSEVRVDGEALPSTTRDELVIEAGDVRLLPAGRSGPGNHTVDATISYPGIDAIRMERALACS